MEEKSNIAMTVDTSGHVLPGLLKIVIMNRSQTTYIDTDVLVIGGGFAGTFAALRASENSTSR